MCFIFSTTAGYASGVCTGNHLEDQSHVPCHDDESSDVEHSDIDDETQEEKVAKCNMCKCTQCKSHLQISSSHTRSCEVKTSNCKFSLHADVVTSLVIYGIDNPPKLFS